jgi:hypothetical protein
MSLFKTESPCGRQHEPKQSPLFFFVHSIQLTHFFKSQKLTVFTIVSFYESKIDKNFPNLLIMYYMAYVMPLMLNGFLSC